MVLMALDHVRDLFSNSAFTIDPTDLTRTTPALFLTRWVTHFCAPVFVFLSGTSVYLSEIRGKTKKQLTWFLMTRGLFLVILDPTLIRHTFFMWDLNWRFTFVQVIWVIGWSMIVLAGLIHLPRWVVAAFGIGMAAMHNLLDPVTPDQLGAWGGLWKVLHVQSMIEPFSGFQCMIAYPLIPWIGVMAAGYAFGGLLQGDAVHRRRRLLALGLTMTVAFIVFRAANVYGDPNPWDMQKGSLFTVLSFVNCTKYPPSLSYLLMTLGPAIAAMAVFNRPLGAVGRVVMVFGRVPMFFYLIHAPFAHVLAAVAALCQYGPQAWNVSPFNPPAVYGFSLPVVYLAWVGVVFALYFPCRWYAGVKQRRRDWWLSYL